MNAPTSNILLLGPPNRFLENPRSVPRIGVLYLASVLKQAGHSVEVCSLASLDELAGIVSHGEFGFIGISATSCEYPDALEILHRIRSLAPAAVVAIGGPHATAMPDECRCDGFDLVVTGEAECEITHVVTMRPSSPEIVHCGFVADLDGLPFPDRGVASPDTWQPVMCRDFTDGPVASMLVSRGCSFRCSFCGPNFGYRRRSDTNIASELRELSARGYAGVVIIDDLPFATYAQVQSFCGAIRPLGIKFRCNFRTDMMTPQIARKLAESGCRRVQFGVESAAQSVLDAAGKRTTPQANGAAVELCQASGIEAKAMFMWGLPGDTFATADAIVDWVDRYRPESIQISTFVPLPGSPLWDSGYGERVSDYRVLTFFGDAQAHAPCGVGNDLHTAEELRRMRQDILIRCAPYTHIDVGLPNRPAGTGDASQFACGRCSE